MRTSRPPKDPTARDRQRRSRSSKQMAILDAALQREGISPYASSVIVALREFVEEADSRIEQLEIKLRAAKREDTAIAGR